MILASRDSADSAVYVWKSHPTNERHTLGQQPGKSCSVESCVAASSGALEYSPPYLSSVTINQPPQLLPPLLSQSAAPEHGPLPPPQTRRGRHSPLTHRRGQFPVRAPPPRRRWVTSQWLLGHSARRDPGLGGEWAPRRAAAGPLSSQWTGHSMQEAVRTERTHFPAVAAAVGYR